MVEGGRCLGVDAIHQAVVADDGECKDFARLVRLHGLQLAFHDLAHFDRVTVEHRTAFRDLRRCRQALGAHDIVTAERFLRLGEGPVEHVFASNALGFGPQALAVAIDARRAQAFAEFGVAGDQLLHVRGRDPCLRGFIVQNHHQVVVHG